MKRVPLKSLSDFQLGWVVAFLEGEGAFSCAPVTNKGELLGWMIQIAVGQVQREPLERLIEYSGVGKIYGPYSRKGGKQAPCHLWRLMGPTAVDLMKVVRAHMSPRRQVQIDVALTKYEARPRRDTKEAIRKMWVTRKQRYGPMGHKAPYLRAVGGANAGR